MKKLNFNQVLLYKTFYDNQILFQNRYPEFAFSGRSNVGKSSFINFLLNKKIAKVSSTPGKTQSVNQYLIDQTALFVDLPGYGFAKAPLESKKKWALAIEKYLYESKVLKTLFLLLDIRREPSKEDFQMAEWAIEKQIPLVYIFTKTDKVTANEKKQKSEKILTKMPEKNPIFMYHSIKNNRNLLIKQFNQVIS